MKFAEHNYLPLFKTRVKVENGFRLHQERDWHKDTSSHIGLTSLKTGKKIFLIMQLLLICYQGLYFNWSDFHRAKKKTGKIRFVNVSFIHSALGVPPLRYSVATELGTYRSSGHKRRAVPFPKYTSHPMWQKYYFSCTLRQLFSSHHWLYGLQTCHSNKTRKCSTQ